MAEVERHGTLRVLVTSMDGNDDHPFQSDETIGDVHAWAYKRLVQDKDAVPFTSTWMEYKDDRIDGSRQLSSFPVQDSKPGREIDLTLALSWISQGGDRR